MNFSSVSLIKFFHLWIKELLFNSFTGVTWFNLKLSTNHAWSRVRRHVHLDIFDLENDSHFLVGLLHSWTDLVLNQIADVSHFVGDIFLMCFFFGFNLRSTSPFLFRNNTWCVTGLFIIFLDNWIDFLFRAFSNKWSAFVSYLWFLIFKSLLMLFIFLVVLSNFECCPDNDIWKICI